MGKLIYQQACNVLAAGGVIAYPTEAVWGLGCDPSNKQAVEKILKLKNRPVNRGLILVAADRQQLPNLWQALSPELINKLDNSWPGQVTWLVPDPQNLIPEWVKGDHSCVAVRISAHPTVRQLCQDWEGPLVSTSANEAGQEEIRSRSLIEERLGDNIDLIVDGELGGSDRPSIIKDLVTGTLVR